MSDDHVLKNQLPYPYNRDPSTVLRRLDRRTLFSRQRLANDPDDENSLGRPLLSFLSRRAVAAEVASNPGPFPRVGGTSTLRVAFQL